MTDTARVLLTAALLSGSGLAVFAWRVARTDPEAPERRIGELRLAQLAAIALAAVGAIPIGLALGAVPGIATHLDAALGFAFLATAGYVLLSEPRSALWIAATAFVLHALLNVAHQPGWLQANLAPRWYFIGCALYDLWLAGLCYMARRR